MSAAHRPIDAGTPETGAKQLVSTSAECRHPSVNEQDVLLSETKYWRRRRVQEHNRARCPRRRGAAGDW
jgi:hypothetical protein